MARKNKKKRPTKKTVSKRQPGSMGGPAKTPTGPKNTEEIATLVEKSEEVESKTRTQVDPDVLDSVTDAMTAAETVLEPSNDQTKETETIPEVTAEDLKKAAKRYERASDFLDSARKEYNELKEKHKEAKARLEEDKSELENEKTELAKQGRKIQDEKEDLARQRVEAETGFIAKRSEVLSGYEDAVQGHSEKIAEKESQLDAREDALQKSERDLKTQTRRLELREANLEEDFALEREKLEAEISGATESMRHELTEAENRLQSARAQRDDYARKIQAQEERDRDFEGHSPEQLHAMMQDLKQEKERLQKALDAAPPASLLEETQKLRLALDDEKARALELRNENAAKREELERSRVGTMEYERIKDQVELAKQHKRLITEEIKELESKITSLIDGASGESSFPSCKAMDGDERLKTPPHTDEPNLTLTEFVTLARKKIAEQSEEKDKSRTLFYADREIRHFLAGLAMSKLHILQGYSGTGKTSLPLAFADAIGAGRKLIEVQAGWRASEDLIGHYNTFEKKYYESKFLQALYEAQTPLYADRPYFIILDEMNLSHPEQYFAAFLSLLEQHDPVLDLMTSPVNPAPQKLIDGRKIRIPENVWFIGTANHDETTKDFADKTYDRAFVMELPDTHTPFEVKGTDQYNPFSFWWLEQCFSESLKKHEKETTRALQFLKVNFKHMLKERFNVTWQNRFELHARKYIPVVCASGGDWGEALDHLFATKILRKIRHRHDIDPDHLRELLETINECASDTPNKKPMRQSQALVESELHRMGESIM